MIELIDPMKVFGFVLFMSGVIIFLYGYGIRIKRNKKK